MCNLVHKVIDIDINLCLAVTEVTESGENVLSDTYKPLRSFSCLGKPQGITNQAEEKKYPEGC